MDDLGLVEAIDRFREGIVVTVADAADRRLDACFREALGAPRFRPGTIGSTRSNMMAID
jgi:hypothetical protein